MGCRNGGDFVVGHPLVSEQLSERALANRPSVPTGAATPSHLKQRPRSPNLRTLDGDQGLAAGKYVTLPAKVDSMEEARLSLGVHDVEEEADA